MKLDDWTTCNNSFCSGLPEELRAELCSKKRVTQAKKKKSFVLDANQIIIVRAGVVIPSFSREDGKEKGLSLKTPGSVFGISQMYSDRERIFNIYVVSNFEGCVFPVSYFETLFEKHIEFAKSVFCKCSENLTVHSDFAVEVALSDSENKVLAFLRMIDSNNAYSGLKLTHEEISILLGINRVTVTKVLSDLKRKELQQSKKKSAN